MFASSTSSTSCGARRAPCPPRAYFLDLFHEMQLGRQPAGGIRDHHVDVARARRKARRRQLHPGRRPPERSPVRHCASPKRRVARARPRGRCRPRRASRSCLRLQPLRKLADRGGLPAPLTPATMMTKGLALLTSSLRSSGARSAAIASFSACFSASPSATFFLRISPISARDASTPQSACSSAVSSSS